MYHKFFKRVWGDTQGYVITARISGDDYKQNAYNYPEQLDILVQTLEGTKEWADVHFYPVVTRTGTRDIDAIEDMRVLWADDVGEKTGVKPEGLNPKPTICWETSQGKYQAIWLLVEPVSPARAQQLNRQLAYALGGDTGAWNITHTLRVPNTSNYKYDPPYKGVLLWDDGPEYTIERMEKILNDTDVPSEVSQFLDTLRDVPPVPDPDQLPTYEELVVRRGKDIPKPVWEIINTVPGEQDDWSGTLWKLEMLLVNSGFSAEEILVLVQHSPWDKYGRDNRPVSHLWREIWKALRNQKEKTPDPSLNGEVKKFDWLSLNDLLIYSKKPEWLVDQVWMQENVGWIAGVGKSFKSVISLDLALSVASGKPFLDRFEVLDPGPVLMVQEEDPTQRVANRIKAIAAAKGLTGASLKIEEDGLQFELPSNKIVPIKIAISTGFSFQDEELIEELEKDIEKYKPKMIVLDPWFMMSTGTDEFKSSEITTFLKILKKWRNDFNCAVAIVHHYRKGAGDNHTRLYGSHALYSWSENSLFVSRDRKTNTVIIDRDIKDADTTNSEGFAVRFEDISDSYKIVFTEAGAQDTVEEITRYLRTYPIGHTVPKDEIVENVSVKDRAVRVRLHELAEQNKVSLEFKGQGGKLYVTTLANLFDMNRTEMEVD